MNFFPSSLGFLLWVLVFLHFLLGETRSLSPIWRVSFPCIKQGCGFSLDVLGLWPFIFVCGVLEPVDFMSLLVLLHKHLLTFASLPLWFSSIFFSCYTTSCHGFSSSPLACFFSWPSDGIWASSWKVLWWSYFTILSVWFTSLKTLQPVFLFWPHKITSQKLPGAGISLILPADFMQMKGLV